MPKLKYILGLLTLIFSLPILAQDWYEIEVLIFEHSSNQYENISDPERWPTDLQLSWPLPLLELSTPEQNTESDEIEDLATIGVPTPFEILPTDQRRLSNANYAMRVREGYNLLWHEAWKAPLLDEESSPWILVQSEELLDGHFRLEGAIRIHLTRYLHLSSELWMTELLQDNSDEQTGFHWSQLPAPEPPQWSCIFIEQDWPSDAREPEQFSSQAPDQWYYPFGCEVDTAKSDEDNSRWEELGKPMGLPLEPGIVAETGNSNSVDTVGIDASRAPSFMLGTEQPRTPAVIRDGIPENIITGEITGNEEIAELNSGLFLSEYSHPVKEIVHISSQRRMRSTELHYIDHPRVGIIAIIHPVEQPVVEEEPVQYIQAPLPTVTTTDSTENTSDDTE